MDYKEKYENLVEAVKKLQEVNPSDEGIRNWVNDNVPELKESEDEKIRKEIARFIQMEVEDEIVGNKWLAWLEKKGESSVCKIKIGETYKCIASPRYTCFRRGDVYNVTDNFVAELINISSDCFVLLEKQDKQETLCDKCKKEQPSHSCQDITELGRCALEKQSEKKPADKVELKFHEGEWITIKQ